jgi:hypothetical protein
MVYLPQGAVRWILVREPASFVLLEGTSVAKMHDADRGLCLPNVWRRKLEVQVPPSTAIHEEVFLGEPKVKLDCTRLYAADGRCTG